VYSETDTVAAALEQVRPCRAFYGSQRRVRPYCSEAALAAQLLRSLKKGTLSAAGAEVRKKGGANEFAEKSGGGGNEAAGGGGVVGGNSLLGEQEEEEYFDHLDLNGKFVLLLSTRRIFVVTALGRPHLVVGLKQVAFCELRSDGVALHLFDPVKVSAAARANAATARGPIRNEPTASSSSSPVSSSSAGQSRRRRPAAHGDDGVEETLVRFIKCGDQAMRTEIHYRIQKALRAAA